MDILRVYTYIILHTYITLNSSDLSLPTDKLIEIVPLLERRHTKHLIL